MTTKPPYSETGWPLIAREGWSIVAAFLLASVAITAGIGWLAGPVGLWIAFALCAALTIWCVWFFRDPARATPRKPGLAISPADGVVCHVGPAKPPPELGLSEGTTRVSIFMNVFNVHVNRSPVEGAVAGVYYHPGKFFNASLDKASEHNERCALAFRLADGRLVGCVQIAGLVARRIVCRAKVGEQYKAGERFGLIRFGSRVDVYLPPGIAAKVSLGQRSIAGETVLAELEEGR